MKYTSSALRAPSPQGEGKKMTYYKNAVHNRAAFFSSKRNPFGITVPRG